jgi:hypothetical protein
VAGLLPADAAWNLRQRGDGTAVWTNERSIDIPIGSGGVVIPVSNFSNSITYYFVAHKPGFVRRVYAVNNIAWNTITNAPRVQIGYSRGDTAAFTPISVGTGNFIATLTMLTAAFEGRRTLLDITGSLNPISQGNVIGVSVNVVGPSGNVPGSIVVVIE